MNKVMMFVLLGLLIPVYADEPVAEGVTVQDIEQDIPSRRDKHLRDMSLAPEQRLEYVRDVYFLKKLDEAVKASGLDKQQEVLEKLRNAKKKIYLEALVKSELEKNHADIKELAEERYQANLKKYRAAPRVKLALIFMKKIGNDKVDVETRKQMEDIHKQLTEDLARYKEELKKAEEELKRKTAELQASQVAEGDDETGEKKVPPVKVEIPQDTLFFELAEKYSQDKHAKYGGINRKWILAPIDMENAPQIVREVFALEEIGDITPLIENEQGFSIFKLMDKKPGVLAPFKDVQDEIMMEIAAEIWDYKWAEVERRFLADEFLEIDDDKVRKLISKERARRVAQEKK